MPVYTRASREYKFVPAIGSSLSVQTYNDYGELGGAATLDIQEGTLSEELLDVDVTNSGSNGAILRERTGADWAFALVLQFPGQLLGGALAARFVEQIIGSSNHILLTFHFGDPLWWTSRGLSALNKRGKALLTAAEARFASDGRSVIGLNLAGKGSGLLIRYEGDVAQGYPLWW